MGLVGKAIALGKKIGKSKPMDIIKKVGKVAHSVIGTADKVLGKMEEIGNTVANIPIVGDTLKGLYKAPILKGVSAEMLFKGAKTGVGIAKKIDNKAQAIFNNNPVANIGTKHLQGQRDAKFRNDILSSGGRHPVIQSRLKGVLQHLQAQNIMGATPLNQVPRTVRHHMRTNVVGSLG